MLFDRLKRTNCFACKQKFFLVCVSIECIQSDEVVVEVRKSEDEEEELMLTTGMSRRRSETADTAVAVLKISILFAFSKIAN